MPSATDTLAKGLLPLPHPEAGLPGWCDRFLCPPGGNDVFSSRLWYDTVLGHALPAGTRPVLALAGGEKGVLLPLLRQADGRLCSLVTPYTLTWRPLPAPGAAMREAGLALGRLLRGGRPARLDTLDAEAPGLEELLAGLRQSGLVPLRFDHFGNWWQPLEPGAGWEAYLAERPPPCAPPSAASWPAPGAKAASSCCANPGWRWKTASVPMRRCGRAAGSPGSLSPTSTRR
ncbi:hypothetical protein ACFQU7_09155 [Pseudoroseomonas wenyumeiae]